MRTIIRHLLPLFLVQFFTWLGLFALWIYATPVITRYLFLTTNAESKSFESGTTWVGIYFAFYTSLAALLAFYIPKLARKISREKIHAFALFMGGLGLLLIYFISNKFLMLFAFAFIGIAWSSIGNIPYSLVGELAPEEKAETYFLVFNVSVVIPQIIAAFLFGFINTHFLHGETIYIMVIGAACMWLAAILMFVLYRRKTL